jgi:hypothetical protein
MHAKPNTTQCVTFYPGPGMLHAPSLLSLEEQAVLDLQTATLGGAESMRALFKSADASSSNAVHAALRKQISDDIVDAVGLSSTTTTTTTPAVTAAADEQQQQQQQQ